MESNTQIIMDTEKVENKTIIEQPTSVSGALDELLNKMYISNVQNRLRQLNEPTENDSKRWIWELLQNAKDSISNDHTRDTVDLKIIVNGDDVKIMHNGAPFTAKAQLGLLYKYSEGKVNNSESTGRFGTGFLTTHTLSKVVSIEGDVYKDEQNTELCGFSATMHRDGIDEDELLVGVEKMKNSLQFTEELNVWTTYTYHLKTHHNRKALELGLKNFIDNVTQTMLFCKEIDNIELDNNGYITSITRGKTKKLDNELFSTEFILESEEVSSRKFIHTSLKEYSDDLTNRFKKDRDIRLTLAIEVDEEKNIIENIDTPSHYCVFPLVGSEKHVMPIYINSPDFEPDSERESLILTGEKIMAGKDVISEGGINRLILTKSTLLFDRIVSFLSQNEYNNLFLLTKGLKSTPSSIKNFNTHWFKSEIINPYREVIKSYKLVKTEEGLKKIFTDDGSNNVLFPKASNEEDRINLFSLVSEIFPNKLPLKEMSEQWTSLVWSECGIFRTEDLAKHVANKANIENLSISDKYNWINQFLKFIQETDQQILSDYRLVPNRLGDFVSLSDDNIAEGDNISEFMINCLKELGNDLNPYLLNDKIEAISYPSKIGVKEISSKIKDRVKEIINGQLGINDTLGYLLPLLSISPTDKTKYGDDFILKQTRVIYYLSKMYPEVKISTIENNDLPKEAWRQANEWVIEILLNKVESYEAIDNLQVDNKLKFINDFISFVSKEIKEGKLDEVAIIPNQNGKFCFKKSLSKDANIPEEIKTGEAEVFGIILKEDLLHKEISSVNISKEININHVIHIIENIFSKSAGDNNLNLAIYLIHLLPQDSSSILYNPQIKLLEIAKKYYFEISSSLSQQNINCSSEGLWKTAIKEITSKLMLDFEGHKNIERLQSHLSKGQKDFDFGDTIIFMNDTFEYLKFINTNITRSIVPNQNGDFCSLEGEFFRDNNIPNDLKEVLILIDTEKDFKNILAEDSLTEVIFPIHTKNIEDIASIIDIKINELYSNAKNWDDENFIQAIEKLMMHWFPKNDNAKDLFRTIFKRKETIEMNILWSLEERQRMQKARSVDPKLLDEFIEESIDIEVLKDEKEKLQNEINELKSSVDKVIIDSRIQAINEAYPDITIDEIRRLKKLEERIQSWDTSYDYLPEKKEVEKRNFINGYKGEAYIYKQLLNSNVFKEVIWEHKSNEDTDLSIIDFEGEKHYISENYSKYDLVVKTHDDKTIYFEVKSTRTSLSDADTIALPISHREWNFVSKVNVNDDYCLARVFEVEENPEGHYLNMKGTDISFLND